MYLIYNDLKNINDLAGKKMLVFKAVENQDLTNLSGTI